MSRPRPPYPRRRKAALTDRSLLTIANIYDFAETCDLDDVRPLLDTQILYNTQISRKGCWGTTAQKCRLHT